MHIFKVPVVQLAILSVIAFVVAFLFNINSKAELLFTANTSILLFVLAAIGMSFMFFGYGTPIMMIFAGFYSALMYESNLMLSVLIFVFSILIAYSGIKLGVALLHDLQGKEGFRQAWQSISMILAMIVVFSIIFEIMF